MLERAKEYFKNHKKLVRFIDGFFRLLASALTGYLGFAAVGLTNDPKDTIALLLSIFFFGISLSLFHSADPYADYEPVTKQELTEIVKQLNLMIDEKQI